jgi:uncharacterized delta-60 repeat protein
MRIFYSLGVFGRNTRRLFTFLLVFLVCGSWMPNDPQAAGQLDGAFGSGGKVVTDLGGDEGILAVTAQPDGKIIAAGASNAFPGRGFTIARYDAFGDLDATWGREGIVNTTFFGGRDEAIAAYCQPDGEVIVAGRVQDVGENYRFGLVRYDTLGNLDPSFGTDGKVTTGLFDLEVAADVAFQSDGKPVVVGFGISNDLRGAVLARYNSDGTLDSSFGTGGKVISNPPGGFIQIRGCAIEPDNKIVVGGFGTAGFELMRYNVDGGIDTGFGTNGIVTTSFGNAFSGAFDIAVSPDGRIVAAGRVDSAPVFTAHSALARYNYDGSLDVTFGNGGKVISPLDSFYDEVFGVAILSDGRIVTCGHTASGLVFVARYTVDGSLDANFATGGFIMTSFKAGAISTAYSITVLPDGRVVAGGNAYDPETLADFALLRLASDFFDSCVQGNNNGSVIQVNTQTGDYEFFNCSGVTVTGKGKLLLKGSIIKIKHNTPDRIVRVKIDTFTKRASASIQLLSLGQIFKLKDGNTADNTCACP